ncbi:hypothetical protein K9M48_00995 [Candidatus Gracilibacteria bacterium]|nr:hypothetical protein [Candidatus Gracilibacteria bacterium]
MEKLQKNFFWVSVCASLLLVHITFIVFDVNVYMNLFWPYIVLTITTLILAAIVFSKMERIMKEIGPEIVIAKYKRLSSSMSFWGIFVLLFISLLSFIFSFGQLFLPRNLVSEIMINKFVYIGWGIFAFFIAFAISFLAKALKLVIYAKTK